MVTRILSRLPFSFSAFSIVLRQSSLLCVRPDTNVPEPTAKPVKALPTSDLPAGHNLLVDHTVIAAAELSSRDIGDVLSEHLLELLPLPSSTSARRFPRLSKRRIRATPLATH